tara:strand:+ start:358 stop:651 length:294 start_codon:yes stop_codon:yes gene_type:complete
MLKVAKGVVSAFLYFNTLRRKTSPLGEAITKSLVFGTTAGIPPVFTWFQAQHGGNLGGYNRFWFAHYKKSMSCRWILLNRSNVKLGHVNSKEQNYEH